jgi:hypothetical protein
VAKRRTENTEAKVNADPMGMFAQMVLGGTEKAILNQEAAGQRQLVASEQIPTDRRGITDEALVKLGFVLGEKSPRDDLFQDAKLPSGWSIKPTDHSMWSRVVDEKGRERFAIFYKAAYYDRSAHMNSVRRFNVRTVLQDVEPWAVECVRVLDGADEIHRIAFKSDGTDRSSDAYRIGEAWLDEHRPGWRDPFALWDQE